MKKPAVAYRYRIMRYPRTSAGHVVWARKKDRAIKIAKRLGGAQITDMMAGIGNQQVWFVANGETILVARRWE